MSNKKRLIDFFQSEGMLFPETEEEVKRFEERNIELQFPLSDWDDPTKIIRRGRQKLKNLNLPLDDSIESDIEGLRMVARKGENLPDEVLKKMKDNQKKNGKDK